MDYMKRIRSDQAGALSIIAVTSLLIIGIISMLCLLYMGRDTAPDVNMDDVQQGILIDNSVPGEVSDIPKFTPSDR